MDSCSNKQVIFMMIPKLFSCQLSNEWRLWLCQFTDCVFWKLAVVAQENQLF